MTKADQIVNALRTCAEVGGCKGTKCPYFGQDCGIRLKKDAATLIEKLLEKVRKT